MHGRGWDCSVFHSFPPRERAMMASSPTELTMANGAVSWICPWSSLRRRGPIWARLFRHLRGLQPFRVADPMTSPPWQLHCESARFRWTWCSWWHRALVLRPGLDTKDNSARILSAPSRGVGNWLGIEFISMSETRSEEDGIGINR